MLIPFQSGKALTWDVIVTHTLAESYHTDIVPGHACELCSPSKQRRNMSILPARASSNHWLLRPWGPINTSSLLFLTELGRRITLTSGNKRETSFLFRRLSVCIQRFTQAPSLRLWRFRQPWIRSHPIVFAARRSLASLSGICHRIGVGRAGGRTETLVKPAK